MTMCTEHCIDLKTEVEHLLDDIYKRYYIGGNFEFTCEHHKKLAELVKWNEKEACFRVYTDYSKRILEEIKDRLL